jgi:WW domain
LKMSSSSDAPLPVDWSKHISSKTGKPYWFNKRTNESRYEAPISEAPPAKRARPDDTGYATSLLTATATTTTTTFLSAAPGAARSTALGVGAAYSALPSDAARGGRGARAFSRTRHLRAFQNWVKAVLISTYWVILRNGG